MLECCDLEPWHLQTIRRQPSQYLQLGVRSGAISEEEALDLAGEPTTAAFLRDGVPIGVMGVAETFPGTHGVAWAIFAEGLGSDHLAITREARRRLDTSALARIEAIAPCADAERIIDAMPEIQPDVLLRVMLDRTVRTPEVSWAMLMGFRPVHVLRKYGMAAESHMLLERIA